MALWKKYSHVVQNRAIGDVMSKCCRSQDPTVRFWGITHINSRFECVCIAVVSWATGKGGWEKLLTFEPAIARGFILHFLIHPNYTCWVVSKKNKTRILRSLRCGSKLCVLNWLVLFHVPDPPPETSISQIQENVNRKKEEKKTGCHCENVKILFE